VEHSNSDFRFSFLCATLGVSIGMLGCLTTESTGKSGSGGGLAGSTGSGGASSSGRQTDSGGSGDSGGTSGAGGASRASGGNSGSDGGSVQGGTSALGGRSGAGGSSGLGGRTVSGGVSASGGVSVTGGASSSAGASGSGGASAGGQSGLGGRSTAGGATGGAATGGSGGLAGATNGGGSSTGTGGSMSAGNFPGDIAKAAGTPMVAAHSMTRAMFAAYTGPLFKALRSSDNQEQDIGTAAGGLVDTKALNTFCTGTTCFVTTLYDQAGNGNDMWRADSLSANQPGTPKKCHLLEIVYWQMTDGTKIPIAMEPVQKASDDLGACLRNRDKTKNMPIGASPETQYGVFHKKYVNGGCCFNYGNTGKAVHYTGPGTLSALNFSKESWWSKGQGSGPWVMVDWEAGVYAGNQCVCAHGALCGDCDSVAQSTNPSVTYDIVTALMKHDGTARWQLKYANAQSGEMKVGIDLPTLPKGYSPLKQEGGIGLGEGGAGDNGGSGGFSEGAVVAAQTSDATDEAIQKSIVSVFGK
jgi:non-reducing end alpha-L-arabinofuranosidase